MGQDDGHQDRVALWKALQPLRSTARFLMTGAHPDDEWNGFLGWLALGLGVRTLYACATRGEGGQNALGPERGRALGALRSREMEGAAREIGLSVAWIGAGPTHGDEDSIHDFGFSKSGDDTLSRWGEPKLLGRLVRLIRTERPDAVAPTFLDVGGQHGHHRAITRTTLRAVELAADPAFADAAGMTPWRVPKVYLAAFSGAGGSYDDEEPPPPVTVSVDLGAFCPEIGVSWAALGERSRAWHASQGMGRDIPPGPRPFNLHLAAGLADQAAPMDGLAHGLSDLADRMPGGSAGRVRDAGAAIDAALAAFPDREVVADALHAGLGALDGVLTGSADGDARLSLKRRQLGRAAAIALGISARLGVGPVLRAGRVFRAGLAVEGDAAATVRVPAGWVWEGALDGGFDLTVPEDAAPFGTGREGWEILGANNPVGVRLDWRRGGSAGSCQIDPPTRLALAPAMDVTVAPGAVVRTTASTTPVLLKVSGRAAPPEWQAHPTETRGIVAVDVAAGHHALADAGASLRVHESARVGAFAAVERAGVRLLRAEIAIDGGARVGVVAGEVDVTLGWLRQLDIAAEAVDDAMLEGGDLSGFSCLLVGILAYGQRPALARARERLRAWLEAGGALVTLYHRPGDGWDPDTTPPRRLEIGRPSVRWRVTDPGAPVTVLAPDHALLSRPNRILESDWDGWVRERGLYFASTWDDAYTPLVAMSDAGEAKLRGGLLAAKIRRGRHVHVALALHHQFAALVPGAFRLLANLVARA